MADASAPRLGDLAGLVFDRAATLWYRALGIEVLAVIASAAVGFAGLSGVGAAVATGAIVALVLIAYLTRLYGDEKYDTAQTMRRQAALSDGLGWAIERVQIEDWRRMAGVKMIRRAAAQPRRDYYGTTEPVGPKRMAEMTLESAFYTRHLYITIRAGLVVAGVVVGLVLLLVVYVALAIPAAFGLAAVVAQTVATVILIAVALDAVGWAIRLTRQIDNIREVERGLDRALKDAEPEATDILRLVAEYDCELARSVPIHPRLFTLRQAEISELWQHR